MANTIPGQKNKFMNWSDSDVQDKLDEIQELTDDPQGPLGAAVYEAAAKVALDAGKMTPVDTGFLRGSTYTEPPKRDGADGIQVLIGQGAEYAAKRHASDSPGKNARSKAHYFRKAIDQNAGTLARKIAIRAEDNLEKGEHFGKSQIPSKLDPDNRENPNAGAWE